MKKFQNDARSHEIAIHAKIGSTRRNHRSIVPVSLMMQMSHGMSGPNIFGTRLKSLGTLDGRLIELEVLHIAETKLSTRISTE